MGPNLEHCSGIAQPGFTTVHVYTCDRQSATGRQSSSCSSSTCPKSHVSITRTAIAKHCISARLTLINHCIALVRAAHVHGNEPRAPCWHWAHVSFTLARASPELDLLNLCRVLQNAAGSGEVVNHGVEKKYLQQRRRGAAEAATAVAASRVTASARRTASLSGLPVEDRVLQSGYRHCGPKTNCNMHHVMVVQTPDWSMLRCTPCACAAAPLRFRQVRLPSACPHGPTR